MDKLDDLMESSYMLFYFHLLMLNIYIALKIAPDFYDTIGQITGFSDSPSINLTHRPVIVDFESNPQLKNLIKLIKN